MAETTTINSAIKNTINAAAINATGAVFKYGDNVDTDVIIPARYLNASDAATLAAHCMEDIDADFVGRVQSGDIIVAGKNFGCGSSREHAPIAIQASGVSCVIAETFARIFYRNAVNIGLPILECAEAAHRVQGGDKLEVTFETGRIVNLTRNETYQAAPFPPFMREIMAAGGLIARAKCLAGQGSTDKNTTDECTADGNSISKEAQ